MLKTSLNNYTKGEATQDFDEIINYCTL